MNGERLGRLLAAALVPLGVVLLVFALGTDEPFGTVLGAGTMILGVAFFWAIDQFPDAEFDVTEPPAVILNVVQVGGVLIVFGLLTYLLSDPESVTQVVRTGIPSPEYPAYAGLVMGVFLGGGVPCLMHQLDMGELSDSTPVRTVGFSITFGTFAILLVHQPPSSGLYAAAYCSSRVGGLVGMYTLSRL